jgi:hypothetical protein
VHIDAAAAAGRTSASHQPSIEEHTSTLPLFSHLTGLEPLKVIVDVDLAVRKSKKLCCGEEELRTREIKTSDTRTTDGRGRNVQL